LFLPIHGEKRGRTRHSRGKYGEIEGGKRLPRLSKKKTPSYSLLLGCTGRLLPITKGCPSTERQRGGKDLLKTATRNLSERRGGSSLERFFAPSTCFHVQEKSLLSKGDGEREITLIRNPNRVTNTSKNEKKKVLFVGKKTREDVRKAVKAKSLGGKSYSLTTTIIIKRERARIEGKKNRRTLRKRKCSPRFASDKRFPREKVCDLWGPHW